MSEARWREDSNPGTSCAPSPSSHSAMLFSNSPSRNDYAGAMIMPGLFILDVRRFDDRPPLFYFGLVVGGESFWGLLLARRNLLALLGISLLNCGIGQRIDDRRIELADDVFGGA